MTGGWRRPVGPEDPGREVDRELRFHLEMRAREFEAEGLAPEDALEAARASFGDVEAVAAACREERRRRSRTERVRQLAGDLGADVRVAGRMLRRDPAFASAAMLVLALGIAVVVAVAGLVDAYLLRGLPFPASERLVHVRGPGAPDWLDAPDVIEVPVSWDLDVLSIVGDRPASAWTSWVAPTYFEAFGVDVQLGRLPTAEEALPGGPRVALISHGLWQRHWGGDADVIGSTFAAYASDRPDEAEIFTVIGVLSPDHWHLNRFFEVLSPLHVGRATYLARLAEGVTLAEADAAIERHARERGAEGADVDLIPVHEAHVRTVRPTLLALGASVLLVLAIACGNAAMLLLVRASGREREFAVRAALGAPRLRLVRQLVVEGLVLSLVAAGLGLALGVFLLRATADVLPGVLGTTVPGGADELGLNRTALIVAIAASTAAGLLFGLAPLAGALRPRLAAGLAQGGRAGADPARSRVRDGLVVLELALSLALLVGAGLLVRSAAHLQRVDIGFDPGNTTTFDVNLRNARYPDLAARSAFFDALVRTVEARVPGVDAEIAWTVPFGGRPPGGSPVETPGNPVDPDVMGGPSAQGNVVSPGYFDLMRIGIRNGRAPGPTDGPGAPSAAVVSASLAERLWPGADPLGRSLRFGPGTMLRDSTTWLTVIGVADDVVKTLVDVNPPDVYVSVHQVPMIGVQLLVRGAGAAVPVEAVRAAVWSLDPEIPLEATRRIADDVRAATLPSRFLAGVLGGFAAFAALLATFGLYGVVSYVVRRQRRDIAIRMALGAEALGVVGLFVRRSVPVLVLGIAAGLAGAVWLSGLLRSQIHGIARLDPLTFAAGAGLLLTAAVVATVIPALRAARRAPMGVLRTD